MAATIVKASSLEHLIDIVQDTSRGWDRVWFRGVKNRDYKLVPSVLREDGLASRERNRNKAFRRQAAGLYPNINSEDYSRWLFIAQHRGLPTRLLDWTESLLVALYFALDNNKTTHPAIWMLDPVKLNRMALDEQNAFVANSQNNYTIAYCKYAFSTHKDDQKNVGKLPLAVYPENIDQNMLVQQSCFTVQGQEAAALDEQYAKIAPKKTREFLKKIVFEDAVEAKIVSQFKSISPKSSVIFPGIDGLIKDLLVDD